MPEQGVQTLQGPDQKFYKVKSKDLKAFDAHFIKQGWVKKGNDWFTQTGEPAKLKVPSQLPGLTHAGGGSKKIDLQNVQNPNIPSIGVTGAGASLPSVGGAVGGLVGKTPGAFLGGAVGEGAREIMNRVLYDSTISDKKGIFEILKQGGEQAGLEYVGGKVGDAFFNLLNKIPHAKIVDGIPMLPSDMKPNSRIRKYAEDLLSNLLPSAKPMQLSKEAQTKAVEKKLDTLVSGLGRFKGTSEQMGVLLQDAVRGAEADAKKNIKDIVKQQGIKTQADMEKLPEYKEYIKTFRDRLVSRIAKEDKPELIAGYLRTDASGLEQIRTLQKAIQEKNPKTWSKVQTKLMQDMISESFTGAKDPTAKGGTYVKELYSGKDFKSILDKVGEEKLKVIFGQDHYDNIENFIQLTSHLGGSSQAGVGKFLNLMFLLPLRTGITPKGMTHMGITAGVVNRAAKVITSTEGMRLYENYIRAVGQNTPRAIKLATDEISAFNHRTDLELEQEHKENVEKFKQANPNYKEQN